MASPQCEDGYTKVANELLEALLRYPFAPTDLRVTLAVMRLTYGYLKKEDTVSYSQIADLTNLDRRMVIRSMKRLNQANVVVTALSPPSDRIVTREPRKWRINKDYSTWERVERRSFQEGRASDRIVTLQRSKDLEPKNLLSPPSGEATKKELPREAIAAAEDLAARILSNNPAMRELQEKKRPATMKRWATSLDRMNRLDGRSWEQIDYLTKWSQSDPFWKANILSAAKLRDKADQLIAKIRQEQSRVRRAAPGGIQAAAERLMTRVEDKHGSEAGNRPSNQTLRPLPGDEG